MELGIATESRLQRRVQHGHDALSSAVRIEKAPEAVLVAEPGDARAHLLGEHATEMVRTQPDRARCGDAGYTEDPRAQSLLPGSSDWRLLLQIDSADDLGMMWGDVGRLYYWIRDQDLHNYAWDATWLVLQCS